MEREGARYQASLVISLLVWATFLTVFALSGAIVARQEHDHRIQLPLGARRRRYMRAR